ncbi:MAG: DUF3783 domain-containing protein [Lachnospiraceae bacterium]|nr:DUF3783 domain-containing protein [Lachnospiraceae bacterium]MCI8871394.1 DUF3783 domain-containing protein [Lachnospiraceae bacterium]MCI9058762.1 DUF3783 domain-containing protein [Lachnospiraceae bacterium]
MKATILLFHFSDKDRRNKLTRALLPLRMKIREVSREDYLQPVGYLAGKKDIPPLDETYDGEELEGEMLLMAGLLGPQVDQVLKAVRKSGIGPVPYKAVLTSANQSWNALKLFQEIKSEHEQMM